jgi:hypothetical protein
MPDRKAQEWRQRLLRFEKSRHTINEFCRQEGVSPQSFYLWRKRLAALSPPVAEQPTVSSADVFRPVRLLPAAGVSVQLPGGTQLVVPTADAQSLRLVIETLALVDAKRWGDASPC